MRFVIGIIAVKSNNLDQLNRQKNRYLLNFQIPKEAFLENALCSFNFEGTLNLIKSKKKKVIVYVDLFNTFDNI
jgi:hypothetical protein